METSGAEMDSGPRDSTCDTDSDIWQSCEASAYFHRDAFSSSVNAGNVTSLLPHEVAAPANATDGPQSVASATAPQDARDGGPASAKPLAHSDANAGKRRHSHRMPFSANYESLNFESIENTLLVNELVTKWDHNSMIRRTCNKWFVCFLIGVASGLVAFMIFACVERVGHWKFQLFKKYFNICVGEASSHCSYLPLLLWIGVNVGFSGLAAFLAIVVARSKNVGLPQMNCYLNGVDLPGVLSLRALVTRTLGVTSSICGGLVVGPEGPMIHSACCVAGLMAKANSKIFKRYHTTDDEIRDFVSVGAASGVAAAFGAPIGGILFSLEEGVWWKKTLVWQMFLAAVTATFVLSLCNAFAKGRTDFSQIFLVNFGFHSGGGFQFGPWEVVLYILIGILGGLFGALFTYSNHKLTIFRRRYITASWMRFVEVLIVAAVTACVGYTTSVVLSDECHEDYLDSLKPLNDPSERDSFLKYNIVFAGITVERDLKNEVQELQSDYDMSHVRKVYCMDGSHSSAAELFFRTPERAMNALLMKPIDAYGPITLSIFCVEMFLLSSWSYGLSIAGGIFVPSLLVGAAWGRLLAVIVSHFKSSVISSVRNFALAGAAAQLAGNVRMTISLYILLIEAAEDFTFAIPLMIILMLAKSIGDYLNEGIYESHIELNAVPILEWGLPRGAEFVRTEQVMAKPVVVVRAFEKVQHVYRLLFETSHNGFPVVDYYYPEYAVVEHNDGRHFGRYRGLILRSQMITLLTERAFVYLNMENELPNTRPSLSSPRNTKVLTLEDFYDSRKRASADNLKKMDLSDVDSNCWVDFRPYMTPAAYTISSKASLSKTYRLFRGLGLRHLVVTNEDNWVVGMITRKDIAHFMHHD